VGFNSILYPLKFQSHLASGDKLMVETNQRRYIRIKPELERPIRVDVNGDNFLEIIYAKDINERGIGFQVAHGFKGCEINQLVSIIVSLPHPANYNLSVKAQIKYISAYKFGAVFHELSVKDRKNIQRYICHRLIDESWVTKLIYKMKMLLQLKDA